MYEQELHKSLVDLVPYSLSPLFLIREHQNTRKDDGSGPVYCGFWLLTRIHCKIPYCEELSKISNTQVALCASNWRRICSSWPLGFSVEENIRAFVSWAWCSVVLEHFVGMSGSSNGVLEARMGYSDDIDGSTL